MNYSTFRQIWDEALRTARFPLYPVSPEETINTETADRLYRVYLHTGEAAGFHTTIEFKWNWDALLSARFATTEEDMLMQIFGDFGIHEDTTSPNMRVDYILHATIAMDQYLPLPPHDRWQRWVNLVTSRVSPLLVYDDPDEDFPVSFSMEPQIEVICSSSGQFYLSGVHMAGFRLVTLPRQWDHPDRSEETNPDEQLLALFQRLKQAVDSWQESLKELLQ